MIELWSSQLNLLHSIFNSIHSMVTDGGIVQCFVLKCCSACLKKNISWILEMNVLIFTKIVKFPIKSWVKKSWSFIEMLSLISWRNWGLLVRNCPTDSRKGRLGSGSYQKRQKINQNDQFFLTWESANPWYQNCIESSLMNGLSESRGETFSISSLFVS